MSTPRRKQSIRRRINQETPIVFTLTGLVVVYGGFIMFADDLFKLLAVSIGIIFIELGVWYGANPVLSSERQYSRLRDEVDRFIQLVRQLNAAVTKDMGEEEVTRVKEAMFRSVETMHRYAGVRDDAPVPNEAVKPPAQLPR